MAARMGMSGRRGGSADSISSASSGGGWGERTERLEIRSLRALCRVQGRQLARVRALAREARLALYDHDLEVVRGILNQLVDGELDGMDTRSADRLPDGSGGGLT